MTHILKRALTMSNCTVIVILIVTIGIDLIDLAPELFLNYIISKCLK